MKVLVLTISDRAYRGVYEDLSGPAVEKTLRAEIPEVKIRRKIVPDEKEMILEAYAESLDMDAIITTGGTGLSTRDITPEVTGEFCDRMIPGIAEYLRNRSLEETLNAVLSRGVAGVRGRTLIVNLPGSEKGARFCAGVLAPVLPHAHGMIMGEGH